MAKVLAATCEAGKVTAEGVEIPGTVILSEGVGASSGILFIDQDRKYYVAKSSPDLDAALEQAIAGLESAASGLSSASSGISGLIPFTTDPILAGLASVAALAGIASAASGISAAVSALEALKGELK